MKTRKLIRLFGATVEDRRNAMGYVLILPWIIGLLLFFAIPMIQAVSYVFFDHTVTETGVQVGAFLGLENIQRIFFVDPDNVQLMVTSIGTTLKDVVLITCFSLFIAVILNQKFVGRAFCRSIFSLTIIISSGVLMMIFKEDLFMKSASSGNEATIFQSFALEAALSKLGIPVDLVNKLSGTVSQVLDLVWKSGVQILLFLAGLQSIPRHLYEVCDVEGSTGWQTFWKVTFPLTTPFLLLNIVYTIIDSFTYYSNVVMVKVNGYMNQGLYSSSTTLAFFYFLLVLVVTGTIALLVSRRVYYVDK